MEAGVGKEKLVFPEELFPIENYEGVHDDVYVRVALFRADSDFAIVCFEMTSLRPYAMDEFRKRTSEITGIPSNQIWICVSHTFSVPHLRSEEALAREGKEITEKNNLLLQVLTEAMESALHTAMDHMQEVRIGYGKTFCSVHVNRDIETEKGWWLGANDQLDSDKVVPIVRLEDKDGKPFAILFGCDVQSSVMDHYKGEDGYAGVSGDLAGAASRFIEEAYGDEVVALFLIGAAGDQAPLLMDQASVVGLKGEMLKTDYQDAGYAFADALGKKLGSQVLKDSEKISCTDAGQENISFCQETVICSGQKIAGKPSEIHPTKTYQYETDEDQEVVLSIVTMGEAAFIGLGPELSSATAMQIRKESPYPVTMIVTLVNGADKYMPESSAYDRITYEAMNSKYAKGSAEQVQRAVTDQLIKKKGGSNC